MPQTGLAVTRPQVSQPARMRAALFCGPRLRKSHAVAAPKARLRCDAVLQEPRGRLRSARREQAA